MTWYIKSCEQEVLSFSDLVDWFNCEDEWISLFKKRASGKEYEFVSGGQLFSMFKKDEDTYIVSEMYAMHVLPDKTLAI